MREKQLETLRALVAKLSDEELTRDERDTLNDLLRESPALRREYTSLMAIHSSLVTHPGLSSAARLHSPRQALKLRKLLPLLVTASLLTLFALAWWYRGQSVPDQTFATLAKTQAAFWEDSDLPTAVGSRLSTGTLRLASGMATLHFDSGAEVIVEAPATLILVDAMNCQLLQGTIVSDIPDSALGFRIKTPSADVVDYGTRFAVSVFEGTGETLTEVMEGKVQVEYADSDKIVELITGQRNHIPGKAGRQSLHQEEYRTIPVPATDFGPEWQLFPTVKDAYTGRVSSHESETLLYLKTGISGGRVTRISWLGFDLKDMAREKIDKAVLLLHFAPTGFGLASFVPDAEFGVYGLVGDVPEWDESILNKQFPGDPQLIHLGSFHVPQGVQAGQFRVRTERLNQFLREHAGSEITLKVVRETTETEGGGLVHGFASHRHPFLPAPTLAIRPK